MKVDINAEIARILHQLPFYIIISFETQSYFDPDSFVSTYKYFNYEYYWHTGVLPWVLLMVTQILILVECINMNGKPAKSIPILQQQPPSPGLVSAVWNRNSWTF